MTDETEVPAVETAPVTEIAPEAIAEPVVEPTPEVVAEPVVEPVVETAPEPTLLSHLKAEFVAEYDNLKHDAEVVISWIEAHM